MEDKYECCMFYARLALCMLNVYLQKDMRSFFILEFILS